MASGAPERDASQFAESQFAEKLRRHRAAAGLTQEELAEQAGLSVRGLRYLEHGIRRPYPETLRRLEDALVLGPDERQALRAAARSAAGPQSGARLAVGALPQEPNPLIGRERDLAIVTSTIGLGHVRVLTLTGPGGVGKTRLALEAASAVRGTFAEVIWVPLATLADPDLLPSAIAQALGVTQTGAMALVEGLVASLRNRSVLLLLDNFEHVAAAACVVSDLVSSCPQLSVLATSRTALDLRVEHEIRLAPLATPASAGKPAVAALAANPAVDLFVRRAQAVQPDFTLTSDNAATVAQICRELEGLPLALELAAARARVLPPKAMLARLRPRLTFLTGTAADLPARQRTMRSTVAWSVGLLTPGEQDMFRRLGVFHGGCTMAAIEAVCPGVGDDQGDVLTRVEALQRASLLTLQADDEEDPRFSMLETIREYAQLTLVGSGHGGDLSRRHAEHFVTVAEAAARGFYTADMAWWLSRVEKEHDNLRAALRWSLTNRDAATALRLTAALWSFWYIRGFATEARAHIAKVLAMSTTPAVALHRAQTLLGGGQLALTQGDLEAATAHVQESLETYRALDDPRGTAEALLAAGFVLRLQEDYDTSQRRLTEALALARTCEHPFIAAAATHHLGLIAADVDHDYPAARALLQDSLAQYRALGLPRFIALLLLALADLARVVGDPDRAYPLLAESAALMTQVGEHLGIPGILDACADLAAAEGRTARAVRLAAAAAGLRGESGTRPWPVGQRHQARWLALARESLGEAAFDEEWSAGETMTGQDALDYALDGHRPAGAPTDVQRSAGS